MSARLSPPHPASLSLDVTELTPCPGVSPVSIQASRDGREQPSPSPLDLARRTVAPFGPFHAFPPVFSSSSPSSPVLVRAVGSSLPPTLSIYYTSFHHHASRLTQGPLALFSPARPNGCTVLPGSGWPLSLE